jgi:hypothetical protein
VLCHDNSYIKLLDPEIAHSEFQLPILDMLDFLDGIDCKGIQRCVSLEGLSSCISLKELRVSGNQLVNLKGIQRCQVKLP